MAKAFAGLDILGWNIARWPKDDMQSLFDLEFPLFSLPTLSLVTPTEKIYVGDPAQLFGSVVDGANNEFNRASIAWATYPSNGIATTQSRAPIVGRFVAEQSGMHKVFFKGHGVLGPIGTQFVTAEFEVLPESFGSMFRWC